MGIYSFNPGEPVYSLGRPIFDKVEINISNGKKFTVIARNNSAKNKFVQSVKLNGNSLESPFINHEDILTGSILEFEMGASENKVLFNK